MSAPADAPLAAVRTGLDRLLPIRDGYADLSAGWSSETGAVVRGELGQRLGSSAAAFLFGEWRPTETTAGAGVRVTW